MDDITFRPYIETDEEEALELWRRTWQAHCPTIDFSLRLPEWHKRWENELIPHSTTVVVEHNGVLIGFVVVNPDTHHLEQLVVALEAQRSGIGSALIQESKRISPSTLILDVNTSNETAIRLYEKHGFVRTGKGKNTHSGLPTYRMEWSPNESKKSNI